MSKMIQIRNVPDALQRALKARAALEGTSMSELILVELARVMDRPSRRELLDRLSRAARGPLSPSPAQVLHEAREER